MLVDRQGQAIRLKQAMDAAKVNQTQLADLIGLKPASINVVLKARNGFKNETWQKVGTALGVSYNWLIFGTESAPSERDTKNESKTIFSGEEPINPMPPRVIYVDASNSERIPLVSETAQAGYAAYYNDEDYIKELPTYSIPGFEHGSYRIFQVKGESMYPTIRSGDYVITSHIESVSQIRDNHIYVIVHKGGIVVKRVVKANEGRKALIIKSDNPAFKDDVILGEEILEVWKYEKKITP